METTTLSSKGQLVIPKALRDAARLVPGAVLSVSWIDGELRLRPLSPLAGVTLDDVAGCLARAGRRPLDEAQTQAAIRARLRSRHAP